MTTACVRCKKTGLVRMERVLKGGHSIRAYYCGGCNHQWQVADDPEAKNLRSEVGDTPDRSRSATSPVSPPVPPKRNR